VIDSTLDGLALLVDAVFLDGKQAGGLDHNFHAQVFPRDGGGVSLFEYLNLLAIDQKTIIRIFNCAVEAAIGRIIFEQVRHCLHVANVVECNYFKFIRIHIANRFENLTANAAKSVNTNFYCHGEFLQ